MAKRSILPPESLSEDSQKFLKFLNESSDLSAVLVATSYLDASLAGMLHRFFIVSQTSDRLLDTRGSLGTFVARADAAYALGLISKVMYQCLIAIAEIRNEFAHHHLELSFASPKVQELCGKLNYIDACFKDANPLEQFMKTVRDRFVLSVVLVSQQLLVLGIGTERRNETKAFSPPIATG
jgi:DNA-binding MltR family transcriptional regulator